LIDPSDFYNQLFDINIKFFTGVPDSLLKEFCLCMDSQVPKEKHIIAANEGNAVAIATGHYLATNKLPLVYMQNSGLGNAINPLLSLCDSDVYSIPMLIMIGWRGEPDVIDEPQHIKQGTIQLELLDVLGLPYEIISKNSNDYVKKLKKVANIAKDLNKPVVLLVKKGTFSKFDQEKIEVTNNKIKREEALKIILEKLGDDAIIISTTGKTSREIFEIRKTNGKSHNQDFLTVGSMGHCSSIALGIALAKPNRKIFCIDGDGAMLMHLGSLATIGKIKPNNFYHILLNNEAHESVGGQETAAKNIDLSKIVDAIGTSKIFFADTLDELNERTSEFINSNGPSFLEVRTKVGSRSDLGRPDIKPSDNKVSFMSFINRQ
tara:strand:+ start:18110 stop:19240 length:1131 start_codon:yes stop_codon:yes gene_type:complete